MTLFAAICISLLNVCKPDAEASVQSVSLSPAVVELNIGESQTLTADVQPAGASNKALEWYSSDAHVASVSTGGVVTAVGVGKTIVTAVAVADNNKRATASVVVNEPTTPVEPDDPTTPTEQGRPRFAVLSDTHVGRDIGGLTAKQRVSQALKHLLSHGEYDAVFIVGDLTNNGLASQYDEFMSIIEDRANIPASLPVYVMMGNHEFYNGLSGEAAQQLYLTKTRQPLHQYFAIKGYPFITISSSSGVADTNGGMAYNDAAKSFLAEHLRKAATEYPDKPVFVFFHIPCAGTVVVSDLWGNTEFNSILKDYPNVIAISGHLHHPLGDPRSIHQDRYTSIQEGSTLDGEIEPDVVTIGTLPENYDHVTEGLIVSVLDNGNVDVERWDTYRDETMLPNWLIEAPFDGTKFNYRNRDGLPAPVFASDAKPTVTDVEDGACKVTYPQAADNDLVRNYVIDILDGTTVVSSYSQFSQYYLNSKKPATLSVSMAIPDGKQLTARVTAVDCYNHRSEPIVSEPFTLAAFIPDPNVPQPVADLLDVVFDTGNKATDASAQNNTVMTGATVPTTALNPSINQWTAAFTGSTSVFYKIDYKANNAIKNAFANSFSFELYYRPGRTGLSQCPMSATEQGGAGLEQTSDNHIAFWAYIGGGYQILTGSAAIASSKWYHLVATYDKTAGKLVLYQDGTPVASANVSGDFALPSATSAQWICLGGDATSTTLASDPLFGEIAIARLYAKALTRDEAYRLYMETK